jgi:hypothetical protein
VDGDFPIRYSPWLRWLFVLLLLGRRRSEIRLLPEELHVRMGWAFDAHVPRSSIRSATRYHDVWWAIGVHTDLHGAWLVNGSPAGIVELRLHHPARGRFAGIPIVVRRLALGLDDPDGFLTSLDVPTASDDPG